MKKQRKRPSERATPSAVPLAGGRPPGWRVPEVMPTGGCVVVADYIPGATYTDEQGETHPITPEWLAQLIGADPADMILIADQGHVTPPTSGSVSPAKGD